MSGEWIVCFIALVLLLFLIIGLIICWSLYGGDQDESRSQPARHTTNGQKGTDYATRDASNGSGGPSRVNNAAPKPSPSPSLAPPKHVQHDSSACRGRIETTVTRFQEDLLQRVETLLDDHCPCYGKLQWRLCDPPDHHSKPNDDVCDGCRKKAQQGAQTWIRNWKQGWIDAECRRPTPDDLNRRLDKVISQTKQAAAEWCQDLRHCLKLANQKQEQYIDGLPGINHECRVDLHTQLTQQTESQTSSTEALCEWLQTTIERFGHNAKCVTCGDCTHCANDDRACIDLQNDPLHCGSCDSACPPTMACRNGQCVCPCDGFQACPVSQNVCPPPHVCHHSHNHCHRCSQVRSHCRCVCRLCHQRYEDCSCQCADCRRKVTDCCCHCPRCNLHLWDCNCQCPSCHMLQWQCGCEPCSDCHHPPWRCCHEPPPVLGCVDIGNDINNCGKCGCPCPPTTVCVQGHCECPTGSGLTQCCDGCFDLLNDPAHCGSCDTACSPTQVCIEGICACPPGTINCDGKCVDPLVDPDHCGGCAPCRQGFSCINGVCQLDCGRVGFALCDGLCADLKTDSANCGSCGNQCPVGYQCVDGLCELDCPAGQIPNESGLCMDQCDNGSPACAFCFDFNNDPTNCGGCDVVCSEAEPTCCSGDCVDLASNPTHCGTCAVSCTIVSPDCCAGVCVDLQTDPANCGGCGVACDDPLFPDCCDGTCTNLNFDPAHCGSCDTACAVDEVCCTGDCANLQTDSDHCGDCATVCTVDVPDCCAGLCTNILTDPANCGGCGQPCNDPLFPDCCDGVCVNLSNDPLHCGDCDTACGMDEVCCSGDCADLMSDAHHCGDCAVDCGTGGCCTGDCFAFLDDFFNCGACNNQCPGSSNPMIPDRGQCCQGVCCGPTSRCCSGICCPPFFGCVNGQCQG